MCANATPVTLELPIYTVYVSIIDDNFTFQKLETSACIEKKVHSTRLDADELVNELIQATDFHSEDTAEGGSGVHTYLYDSSPLSHVMY